MKHILSNNDTGKRLIIAQSKLADGNMSFARGNADEVISNRRKFLDSLGLNLDNLAAPHLVHGTDCEIVSAAHRGKGAFSLDTAIPDTDALITKDSNVIIAVTTADCLPVFLWCDDFSIIGIAHAGWKGLADKILKSMVNRIRTESDVSLYKLHAMIGVGVGRCCYYVDTDRLKRFLNLGLCHIHERDGEKVQLDLKEIARIQLEREGIPADNNTIETECSSCGNNYPSYRRMGENFITDLAVISISE